MGFLKFLRPSHAGSSDRDKAGGSGGPSASSEGLAPPTPLFYGPSSSTSRVPSSSSVHLTDADRDPALGRPDSPAGSFASSRKDRDKKQRLLGIGRREKELKTIPYSTFTPPSQSTASITKDESTLLSPPIVPAKHEARQRSSSQLARPPTSPIAIHQRTSSIPSAPPPPAPAPELGSLDFGSPLGNGQRFSAIFAEVMTGKTVNSQDVQDKPVPSATLTVPSFSPAPSAPNPRPISGISMDGIGSGPSVFQQVSNDIGKDDVREVERLKIEEEKEKEKKSAFWKVRNRRNSKGGEVDGEERMEVVASAEPKSFLREPSREPSDKPKLRRPSSSVWQFARNRTSSYNMTDTVDASALDTNESAIDDGSFQLKSFRHVSSASMSLPAAVDQTASPTLEAPPPLRPDMHSRAPSATGSINSFDDDRPPTRVSVAAFRKGIRAHSFVALDKDSSSTRPSVAGTAPPLGVGPDDDLPLSFLAGDTFKQKQQTKRPSLPNTYTPAATSFSSAPASPTTAAPPPPPSAFARRGASPLRSDEATEQLGLSIQRPRSVTKASEASKGFVVLSRTASRTDLTGSPSQPPAAYTSPGQGSEEMLMPSSEEICTSPLEMEMPSNIQRMIPENGRRSPGPAMIAPRRNSLQPNALPIPVPSPSGAIPRPAETSSSSRPASFFDDPLRLISSFIGREDEPRIPTPPPRSDDGLEDNEEYQTQPIEEIKKDDSLGLELAGLNLPLPPHAMPDDAPASPRSSLGRGPGPRPTLHARLASASGARALGSPTNAPLASPSSEARPPSLLSPAQIKPAATRRDSHESDWRRPPVRPKASVSSMQSSGAKTRGNTDAWADSSSDDDAPPKRKVQGSTPKVPTAILPRPSLGNMRVASSMSAQMPPPTHVPKAVAKLSMAQRRKEADSSSSESEEDASSSSSDEPLATVRQKASMSSLNVSVVPKAAAPPTLGNRRQSASANRPPSNFEHTPPTLPRHASSRSSLYQSSPAALNTTLPSPPVLASNAPKRSPQTFAPALRGQPSPASSVSGKTGDSSSLGAPAPSTPKDSRRVSFLPDDAKGTLKARASASVLGDAERDLKRNERRREEAKQAVELGNLVNGPKPHVSSAEPLTLDPVGQNGYNPYMNPAGMNPAGAFDPRMAWAMQQAAAGPHYAMMHQQAMAFAKQQYQQAMAAAAMQAANDEWERSSAMTGFSGAPSLPAMPSYGGYPTSPYGMPQMFPAMSNYAGSEYGGGRASMYGSPGGGWGSQSVYGESFGPPPALPPMPTMPRSSTSHDVRSDMPTPRKERMSSFDADGATPRRRHFSSSSVDLPKVLAGPQQSGERRHPGGARQARKAPLLQAHGGVPSAPSSWRRDLDEREELDDRQKERARPRGAR